MAAELRIGPAFAAPVEGYCSESHELTATRLEDDSWVVERNALIGLAFKIRVAGNGRWAAVEKLSFPVR